MMVCVKVVMMFISVMMFTSRVCINKREEAESEAQRGKPKGTLESESRIAMLLLVQRPPRHAEL